MLRLWGLFYPEFIIELGRKVNELNINLNNLVFFATSVQVSSFTEDEVGPFTEAVSRQGPPTSRLPSLTLLLRLQDTQYDIEQ